MTITAGSGTDERVAALMARQVDDGSDRLRWLRARQGTATATMAKDLVRGGAAARAKVIAASFEEPVELTGNRYVDRGHEREPWIAAWVLARYGVRANAALFRSEQNPRHTATPDGIGFFPRLQDDRRFDDAGVARVRATGLDVILAEIKTSKHDLDPALPYFDGTGYFEQMQWQMYVLGAERTLFVWEQHDDAWPDPQPLDLEPRVHVFQRDERVIARMIAAADLMLAERDAITGEQPADGPHDAELRGLALAVLSAREERDAAEARLKTPWTNMQTLLADRASWTSKDALAQITWTNETTTKLQPDEDAAKAAHVDGMPDDVTGWDLLADLARAQSAWAEHLARFKKPVDVATRKLTVTAPKAAKA